MAKINKAGLVEAILTHDTFQTKRAATEVVDILFDTIKQAVINGDTVAIHQFGAFKPATRAAASGTTNGINWVVADRTVPTFKASSTFRDAVIEAN